MESISQAGIELVVEKRVPEPLAAVMEGYAKGISKMFEQSQKTIESMKISLENERLLNAERLAKLEDRISGLYLHSLPTTGRAIFDAIIVLSNSETESSDNHVQVLLADGAEHLQKAGVTPLAAVSAFADAFSHGNSSAHTVPMAFALEQLEVAKLHPSKTPLSSNTINVLAKLLPICVNEHGMVHGVYANWSKSAEDTKRRIMKDGRAYISALEAPDDTCHEPADDTRQDHPTNRPLLRFESALNSEAEDTDVSETADSVSESSHMF